MMNEVWLNLCFCKKDKLNEGNWLNKQNLKEKGIIFKKWLYWGDISISTFEISKHNLDLLVWWIIPKLPILICKEVGQDSNLIPDP